MSVYIRGMEMPTSGLVVSIYKLQGKFYASAHGTELCPIVEVPPHGSLIDADELKRVVKANDWSNPAISNALNVMITRMPTIIPADADKEA